MFSCIDRQKGPLLYFPESKPTIGSFGKTQKHGSMKKPYMEKLQSGIDLRVVKATPPSISRQFQYCHFSSNRCFWLKIN